MKIVLYNDFHKSKVTLIVRGDIISPRQVKRAKRELCGLRNCTCGDSFGCRGPQPDLKSKCLAIEPCFDERTKEVYGRLVEI